MPILAPNGSTAVLAHFPVVELRRYRIVTGQRANFATYFDAYFPDAFQQTGAIIAAQLFERDDIDVFTWLRGFHSYDDRAAVNTAFYTGPLWAEHGPTMNARLVDHENTLLLQPASPRNGLTILRAVDAVTEAPGTHGFVMMLVSRVAAVDDLLASIEETIATADVDPSVLRSAGVLITMERENNFPGLPFRTDGPYVVWITLAASDTGVAVFAELVANLAPGPGSETIVTRPTARSRLRWLGDADATTAR